MNVDLPAPFGPATTTRPGAPSAAAARSDANGRTLTTSRDKGTALEAAARAAAVRGNLDHAVGIVWVSRIDRPAARANPGLDRFAIGIAHDPCEHVVNLLRADVSWHRETLPGTLEGEHLAMSGHHFDRAAERRPVLDLRGDRAVRALRFRLGALEEPVRDLHRCRHGASAWVADCYHDGSRLLPRPGRRKRRLRAARSPATRGGGSGR